MLRNKLLIIVYIVLLSITCVNLVACGNNDANDENKNLFTMQRNGLQKKNYLQRALLV